MFGKHEKAQDIPHRNGQQDLKLEPSKLSKKEIIENIEKLRQGESLGYGPRYLHSTGQLHKDGPNTGLFLLITAHHENDVPIPGRPFSFGVLADAQALGDLRALKSTGRRVTRVPSNRGDVDAILKLLDEVG